jgi:hypothetical protein
MSNTSNLYAEKVFAEHPTSLWSLDENVDYISLIPESARDLVYWTADSSLVAASNVPQFLNAPFPNSYISKITAYNPAPSLFHTAEFSKAALDPNAFDPTNERKTFNLGFFVYADNPYNVGYEIGYRYTDPATSTLVEKAQYFSSNISGQWLHLSHTFDAVNTAADIIIFLRVTYAANMSYSSIDYYVNGISVGQWSEEFAVTSLGISVDDIETVSTTSLETLGGLKANAYGLITNPGYYLYNSESKQMACKNTSVPMVYGSSNVTKLFHNYDNMPSFMIPSSGMLTRSGSSKFYTLEFWLRVNQVSYSNGNDPSVLVEITPSNVSIEMDGPFLILNIANKSEKYFIGDWSSPRLMDLYVSEFVAGLMINGETVLEIDLDESPFNYLTNDTATNRWVRFYCPSYASSVELDVPAIYAYKVPAIVAKRRFGYGQAVESPEGSNRSFGGQLAAIDYAFADYTNNYSYPDIGKWNQGILENVQIKNNALIPPEYTKPEIVLESETFANWLADQDNGQITFGDPGNKGYLLFNNFNILKNNLAAFYLIFKVSSLLPQEQVLLRIQNESNNNYFQISIINENIVYKLKYGASEQQLHSSTGLTANSNIFTGINIKSFSDYFGGNVAAFFSDVNKLKFYFGGTASFEKTFMGDLVRVGLCTSRNFNKISQYFIDTEELDFWLYESQIDAGDEYFGNNPSFWAAVLDGGSPGSFGLDNPSYSENISSHIASYTLYFGAPTESEIIKIATDSYWEDYVPLTYFAQYVQDQFNEYYYDLDFIQFNSSYPALPQFDGAFYNTNDYLIKTYITFQYLSTGANAPESTFVTVERAPKNNIVIPGDDWMTTKYEIVDGTVIYPPSGIDINSLAIVTHLEFKVLNVLTDKLVMKKLEYASEAFNDKTANPVGTKFGLSIFPYTQYRAYFDYKARNPFRIYKGSTPHLYLNRNSGIEILGQNDRLVPRGILVQVNPAAAPQYKVIGAQMFLRSNQDRFPSTPELLFEIQGTEEYLRFFIESTEPSGKRARIYGINAKTGATENAIAYYINGKPVREPVVSIDEWIAFGIAFAKPFNFNEAVGAIRFVGPMLVNNIAHYESSALQEIQRQSKRSWFGVESTYDVWYNVLRTPFGGNYNWDDILVVSESSYFGINPEDIYNTYVGTNKIIIDDYSKVTIANANYEIITDVEWQSQVS